MGDDCLKVRFKTCGVFQKVIHALHWLQCLDPTFRKYTRFNRIWRQKKAVHFSQTQCKLNFHLRKNSDPSMRVVNQFEIFRILSIMMSALQRLEGEQSISVSGDSYQWEAFQCAG